MALCRHPALLAATPVLLGALLGALLGCDNRGATPAAAHGQLWGRLVATNQGDDSLSAVDPSGKKPVLNLPLPVLVPSQMEMAHELSVDPQGRFLVMGLMEMPAAFAAQLASSSEILMMNSTLPGWLLKLGPDGQLLGQLQVEEDNGDNALSSDGEVAFVSHYDLPRIAQAAASDAGVRAMDSNLWSVRTSDMTALQRLPVCAAAHILALTADSQSLYVTCAADEIARVDVSDPAHMTVRRIPEQPGVPEDPGSPQLSPFALAVSPLDGSVWVSNWSSKDVRVYDPTVDGFVATFPLAGTPVFTSFNKSGDVGFTAYQQPDGLLIFDVRKRQLRRNLPLAGSGCQNAHQLILSDEGGSAYLLCEGDHANFGAMLTLDTATWAVRATAPLGVYPVEMDLFGAPPSQAR